MSRGRVHRRSNVLMTVPEGFPKEIADPTENALQR